MKTIKVLHSEYNGTVDAIPSKSDAHRAIICALLSHSRCRISPIIMSDDIRATIGAAKALGAECSIDGNVLTVDSSEELPKKAVIDCMESGSTLRFMLPVAAALGIETEFHGRGRLPMRPVGEYVKIFSDHGADMSADHLPITVSGKLTAGEYSISGNVSSQYITGLLMALCSLGEESKVHITTALESKGYVDMTLSTLKKFGADITDLGWCYVVRPSKLRCDEYRVEGDWSQASYFLAAGAVNGCVSVGGLSMSSLQADRRFFGILKQFGGDVFSKGGVVTARRSELFGSEIDASQCPDLVPSVAVLAAFAKGDSVIYNASRLRLKESDRIRSVCDAIEALGGEIVEYSDGMKIKSVPLKGGNVDCCNDHRIAMAFSVAAGALENGALINGFECINKSYPEFYEDYEKIGGKTDGSYR